MNRIYLDYAATTPINYEVKKAMGPYFSERFGNPNSLHYFGQQARRAIDESREKIAKSIGADFGEIIFTGSATEANNLALRGTIKAVQLFSDGTACPLAPAASGRLGSRADGSAFGRDQARRHSETFRTKTTKRPYRIIVSGIEHESILETARDLEREGVEVIYLAVDKNGIVDLKKLKNYLNDRTILVSIMYANNEIGSIQPISEIGKIISEFKGGNIYP
ncbi:MAG: aminotransferase class V-fold PLP-dependent enzyme, partial [Patescibacteria group bacterium]